MVTIAGLGGLLLGHKGGVVRKTFYSSVAALVALSACYPKQSAQMLDQIYLRIERESKNLMEKPVIMKKKNHIFQTDESVRTIVQGDYGQGTPTDQHLYTTRTGKNDKNI